MEGIDSAVQAEVNRNDAERPAKAKAPKKVSKPKVKKAPAKKKPAKKASKPRAKAKKKPVKKAKKTKKAPAKKTGKPNRPVTRPHRLDMRLSTDEKRKIAAKAKAKGVTITKLVYEAIAKLK